MPAPYQSILTKIFTGALGRGGFSPRNVRAQSGTFLAVVPIESHCYAVRLMFANHLSDSGMHINSATIYPSDSYDSALEMNFNRAMVRSGLPIKVGPTGHSSGYPVTFDCGGKNSIEVNNSGKERSFRVPPNAHYIDDIASPYEIQFSDFVPCESIGRADGSSVKILFIYVCVGYENENHWTIPAFDCGPWTDDSDLNNGRGLAFGIPSQYDINFTDDLTSSSDFKGTTNSIIYGIQYLTHDPGINILISGDSLSTSPPYGCPLLIAGSKMSNDKRPIEVSNIAWGGTASAIYGKIFDLNFRSLFPSMVALQALSRNDGYGTEVMDSLLINAMSRSYSALMFGNARTIWNNPGCIPQFDDIAFAQVGFKHLRTRVSDLTRGGLHSLIDGPGIIGEVDKPWLYRDGFTNDGSHPNIAAAQVLSEAAAEAIKFHL